VTAAAALLIVMAGGLIFYNTNVLNEHYRLRRGGAARRSDAGGQHENPQPQLTVSTCASNLSRTRKAEIRGTYRLVNSSPAAIDSIHVATAPGVATGETAFDRPAARVVVDDDLGHRVYSLEKPLQPGDSLELRFEVRYEPHGFTNNGVDASVVATGTYFTNLSWLPAIGYQRNRELSDDAERRAHGLAPARNSISRRHRGARVE
jgi:hypothetical protein